MSATEISRSLESLVLSWIGWTRRSAAGDFSCHVKLYYCSLWGQRCTSNQY